MAEETKINEIPEEEVQIKEEPQGTQPQPKPERKLSEKQREALKKGRERWWLKIAARSTEVTVEDEDKSEDEKPKKKKAEK